MATGTLRRPAQPAPARISASWPIGGAGTPKAGVFAEGQATVVAAQINAQKQGTTTPVAYDGRGICYMEVGHDIVAKVDVTFVSGQSPIGDLEGPSAALAADKVAFGSERARRWFGKTWHATQPNPPPA